MKQGKSCKNMTHFCARLQVQQDFYRTIQNISDNIPLTSGSSKDFKVRNKMSLQFVHDMTRGYVLCFVLCMSDRNLLNATRAGIASFCKK